MKVSFLVLCIALISINAQEDSVPSSTEDYDYEEEEEGPKSFVERFKEFEYNIAIKIMGMATSVSGMMSGGSGGDDDTGAGMELSLSSPCRDSLIGLGLGIVGLSVGPIRIFDSIAKSFDGIFQGNLMSPGEYDECLYNHEKKYDTGNYCLIKFSAPDILIEALQEYQQAKNKSESAIGSSNTIFSQLRYFIIDPKDLSYYMGLCLPRQCKESDLAQLLNVGFSSMGLSPVLVRLDYSKPRPFKYYEKVLIGIFSAILFIVVIGTIVDMCWSKWERGDSVDHTIDSSTSRKLFRSLSLSENISSLMDAKRNNNALDCMAGLIVCGFMAIIQLHTNVMPHKMGIYRFRAALNLMFNKLTNGNFTVFFDTIFFSGGFVFIYTRWKDIHPIPIWTYILNFVIKNYLRFVFIQILIMGLFFLCPLIGSGPMFGEFVEEPLSQCKSLWWTNLLMVQNFWRMQESCLPHTWILAVLMQLFVLSAGSAWILDWWPKAGVYLNILIIFTASIIVGLVTTVGDFPPTVSPYFYDHNKIQIMLQYLTQQCYDHIGPFYVGVLTAYAVTKSLNQKLPMVVVLFCWISSILTMGAIIYGTYNYYVGEPMAQPLVVFYASVHRPLWACALGWIVYACATGYGGCVADFLASSIFIVMERLCYMTFMVHIPVMFFLSGMRRHPLYASNIEIIMQFLALVVISFLLAFVLYIFIQAPYQHLECYVFKKCCKSPKVSPESPIVIQKEDISVLFSKTLANLEGAQN